MPSADQYTSASYAGLAAIMNPQKSWVAKWQRNDKFVTGMYALRVMGRLSADLQDQMMDEGIKYRPRDGSVQD
ncbi:transcription elongation factor spt4 [Borealophlyctis nickersoniae]|nr:transcription elongation factor spt4 [Borealophlyctis nickersoniae]